jgi:hypothetical protein
VVADLAVSSPGPVRDECDNRKHGSITDEC